MTDPSTINPTDARTSLSADQKYNFFSCLIDSMGWSLGIAFFSTSTIVPAFLSKLGADNVLIGLLPAFITIGYNVPGIFVANHIAGLPRARTWLFPVALTERVPLLLMGIAALTMRPSPALLWTFLIFYGTHSVVLGLNQPAYWVMIAKSIPASWRGRLFGSAGLVGGILGFSVVPITSHFLRGSYHQLITGFGWCFVIGALIEFACCLPLGFVREPISTAASLKTQIPTRAILIAVWKSNGGFRRFIWGQVLLAIWMIATPFYLLDGIRRLHVTDVQAGIYAGVSVVVTAFGGCLCGVLSDRIGNRIILIAACVAALMASTYALIAPSPALLSIVFVFSAIALAGSGLAGYNVTMEFAPTEQDVPHFTAIFNVVVSPVRAVALISGGLISQRFGYAPVFILSALAATLSILSTYTLVEPRHENLGGRMEESAL